MPDDKPSPSEESFGQRLVRVTTAAAHALFDTESEQAKVPPGQCTHVRVTIITPTSISLAWKAPTVGTPPIHYTIFVKRHNAAYWSVGAVCGAECMGTVTKLKPKTEYDLEIFAHSV